MSTRSSNIVVVSIHGVFAFFSPVAMSIFDFGTSLHRKLKPVRKYLYFNEAIGLRASLRNDHVHTDL